MQQKSGDSILTRDIGRFKKQGFIGTAIGVALAISWFYFLPILAQKCWPSLLAWLEARGETREQFYLFYTVTTHYGFILVCNLFYWFLYHNEFAFIE